MRHPLSPAAAVLLALPAVLPCSGCSAEEGRIGVGQGPPPSDRTEETVAAEDETPAADTSPALGVGDTGGRSSLGAAKRSARNTVGALEQRQSEIEKQIEEDNE